MNKRLITLRNATGEAIFAVVDFDSAIDRDKAVVNFNCATDRDKSELLGKLELAVAEWAAQAPAWTGEGFRRAFAAKPGPEILDVYLRKHGLSGLDVEIYSQDGRLVEFSCDMVWTTGDPWL